MVGQPMIWFSYGRKEILSKLLKTYTCLGSRWRNFLLIIVTARRILVRELSIFVLFYIIKLLYKTNEWFNQFSGEYSCLKVDLLFKREFSYYLIQIYIPCCMLVIVSWVSFWLDQSAVPARVSLGNLQVNINVSIRKENFSKWTYENLYKSIFLIYFILRCYSED